MSLTALQRVAMAQGAQGMGDLNFGFMPIGGVGAPGDGSIFGGGNGGGGGFQWDNLINASAFTLSNIFGRPGTNTGGQPQQSNTLTVAEQLAIIEEQRRAAERSRDESSAAVSSRGIRIGEDTYISWVVIGLFGVGVYLIQSPGFSRRR